LNTFSKKKKKKNQSALSFIVYIFFQFLPAVSDKKCSVYKGVHGVLVEKHQMSLNVMRYGGGVVWWSLSSVKAPIYKCIVK
jgi:hypothetical protein